jgi:toxin ParE1/3/4
MEPQFRLTVPAIQDIEQIADYIARQAGLKQSEKFLNKLDCRFAQITQFPNLVRLRNEILPGLRSLPMDNYLILYMPVGRDIEILRVVSGYRNLSTLFEES